MVDLFSFDESEDEKEEKEEVFPNLSEMPEEEEAEEKEEQVSPHERSRDQIAYEVYKKSQSNSGVDIEYVAKHYRLPVVIMDDLIERGRQVAQERE